MDFDVSKIDSVKKVHSNHEIPISSPPQSVILDFDEETLKKINDISDNINDLRELIRDLVYKIS